MKRNTLRLVRFKLNLNITNKFINGLSRPHLRQKGRKGHQQIAQEASSLPTLDWLHLWDWKLPSLPAPQPEVLQTPETGNKMIEL